MFVVNTCLDIAWYKGLDRSWLVEGYTMMMRWTHAWERRPGLAV